MTSVDLVGRDAEQHRLSSTIDQIQDKGGALLVIGDVGVGKSSLLRSVAAHARASGLEVLETVGVETEAFLPFAGLHQLLRPVAPRVDELPVAQRRALQLAISLAASPAPEPDGIAVAVLELLALVARDRPVVVLADDVQWLDAPTHHVLAFLARRVSDLPVVVVCALRPGFGGPLLDAGLPVVEIAPLNDRAARALLASVSASAGLTEHDRRRILQEAEGNPLALVELPRAWLSADIAGGEVAGQALRLTSRLQRAFGGQLAELPRPVRDAVLVAALDSASSVPEILSAASIMADEPVDISVLERAASAGLLVVDEKQRVRFRHPLVRAAVLHGEPVRRRRDANAALANVLSAVPDRSVWHRAQSVIGVDDQVADELEAHHIVALREGSVASAIWALERSAQLSSGSARRGRRFLMAAEHTFGLGRPDIVDRLIQAAGRTDLSDLDRARMTWLREIFSDGVAGDAQRVAELCDTATSAFAAGESDLGWNLLLGASLRCWWGDGGPTAPSRVASGAVTARAAGEPDDPRYLAVLAIAQPVEQGAVVAERLALATAGADAVDLRLLGMAAHAVGDSALAADLLDRSEILLRAQGRTGLLAQVLSMQATVRVMLGDWGRAAEANDEALFLAEASRQPMWAASALVSGAMIAALSGESERAMDLAARSEEAASRHRMNTLVAGARLARACAWLSSGRSLEAFEELRQLFDPTETGYHPRARFNALMFLAEAAVPSGRIEEAREVLTEMEHVATRTPAPILRIHLLYSRAALADEADAEACYLDALADDLSRWPWPKARIELAYGVWLRRQRRVSEARSPLRSARVTLDLIGATGWADQAHSELLATGEHHPDASLHADHQLSAQELEIALLAAEGLTNREIGQRLRLSPRTVGSHLYRIFPKLAITSRSQLAGRLHGR